MSEEALLMIKWRTIQKMVKQQGLARAQQASIMRLFESREGNSAFVTGHQGKAKMSSHTTVYAFEDKHLLNINSITLVRVLSASGSSSALYVWVGKSESMKALREAVMMAVYGMKIPGLIADSDWLYLPSDTGRQGLWASDKTHKVTHNGTIYCAEMF